MGSRGGIVGDRYDAQRGTPPVTLVGGSGVPSTETRMHSRRPRAWRMRARRDTRTPRTTGVCCSGAKTMMRVGNGVGVGVGVGVAVGDGSCVGEAVGLGVGVGVGVGAGVEVGRGVALADGVGVAVGDAVGCTAAVGVGVGRGVGEEVGEEVGKGVLVGSGEIAGAAVAGPVGPPPLPVGVPSSRSSSSGTCARIFLSRSLLCCCARSSLRTLARERKRALVVPTRTPATSFPAAFRHCTVMTPVPSGRFLGSCTRSVPSFGVAACRVISRVGLHHRRKRRIPDTLMVAAIFSVGHRRRFCAETVRTPLRGCGCPQRSAICFPAASSPTTRT